MDARYLQLAALSSLLLYGLFGLSFEVQPANVVAIFATAQLVQWLGDRSIGRSWDPRSALVTSFGLSLLLRTNHVPVAIAAAAVAIASKYVLRWNGRHVFNPANLGLIVAVAGTGQAWVSPGQWGNAALLGFLVLCLGATVVQRAERSDVTFAFLAFYAAMQFGRSWWVGEPMAIPAHRLQSGALLLFAFFMISDPKTTPNRREARILYAALVVGACFYLQYTRYMPGSLVWALFLLSPVVPVLDRLFPAEGFEWRRAGSPARAVGAG